MNNIPERIYLQHENIKEVHATFYTVFSNERLFDTDIEYIRAQPVAAQSTPTDAELQAMAEEWYKENYYADLTFPNTFIAGFKAAINLKPTTHE